MQLKIGDKITFKAVCRWRTRTITREVLSFYRGGDNPVVDAYGMKDFVVKYHEISAVNGVPV